MQLNPVTATDFRDDKKFRAARYVRCIATYFTPRAATRSYLIGRKTAVARLCTTLTTVRLVLSATILDMTSRLAITLPNSRSKLRFGTGPAPSFDSR